MQVPWYGYGYMHTSLAGAYTTAACMPVYRQKALPFPLLPPLATRLNQLTCNTLHIRISRGKGSGRAGLCGAMGGLHLPAVGLSGI